MNSHPPSLSAAVEALQRALDRHAAKRKLPTYSDGEDLCGLSRDVWNAFEKLMLESPREVGREIQKPIELLSAAISVVERIIPPSGASDDDREKRRRLPSFLNAMRERLDDLQVRKRDGETAFRRRAFADLTPA